MTLEQAEAIEKLRDAVRELHDACGGWDRWNRWDSTLENNKRCYLQADDAFSALSCLIELDTRNHEYYWWRLYPGDG